MKLLFARSSEARLQLPVVNFFVWAEAPLLPFYFSNSHGDFHCFQITGNFHILCTKLTNGSPNYTTIVTLKSDSRLRNSIRIGIFNYLAIQIDPII